MEDSGANTAHKDVVHIVPKGELLDLGACNVVGATSLAVDVRKPVVSKVVRLESRHLRIFEVKGEDAFVLRLGKRVVVPWEFCPLILLVDLVSRIFFHLRRKHPIVADLVLRDLNYPSIDIEEGCVFSDKLVA